MFHIRSFVVLLTGLTYLGCSDSAISGTEGDSSSEQLEASSSLLSSAKKTSSGAHSSGASSTLDPSSSSSISSSSSSSEKASSTSNVYWNQAISYGVLTDSRDKKSYRTTKIGSQNWMAENLNYTAKVGTSRCYDAKTANCSKYGRLYDWEAASASCPEGWHLPDTTEWNQLAKLLGGTSAAGKILKASTTLWSTNSGNDAFGFAALPSGSYDNEQYYDLGTAGLWWTSSELNKDNAYYRDVIGFANALRGGQESKAINLAVRCVEDSEAPSSSSKVISSSSKIVSSSSEVASSSSEAVSSSAVALVPPDRNCTYVPVTPATSPATGTLTCPNNEVYKTVTIGSAIWMAQNLNYGKQIQLDSLHQNQENDDVIEKFCYNNGSSYCTTEGGFYQWAEAMGFPSACNSYLTSDPRCNRSISPVNHQGICPTGWHIPQDADWTALSNALGGGTNPVAKTMKLNNTEFSSWNSNDNEANDGNSSGFSAFPTGSVYTGSFSERGSVARFWETTESSETYIYIRNLFDGDGAFAPFYYLKIYGFPIRCVMNP